MKCFMYVRSTSFGPGREQQVSEMHVFAQRNCIEVIGIFGDSAGEERPGFFEMMERVRGGGVDAVIVWRLDRLDEVLVSVDELFGFVADLGELGLSFFSVMDGIDSRKPASEVSASMIRATLAAKLALKGERVHLALKSAKDSGERVGRKKSRDDVRIHELRAKGLSIRAIAKELGISTWSVHASLNEPRL